MRILIALTIVTGIAFWGGQMSCADSDGTIDLTGRTSIVVELENGDWAELRGPARFAVLDGFAPPDNPVREGDYSKGAQYVGSEGIINNPYCAASTE